MKLIRDDANEQRIFGTLQTDAGEILCQTLERHWNDNVHGDSCIPEGSYPAFRFDSPHLGYELFQLANVPDRVGIDLHRGNVANDSQGCILLGTHRGVLGGVDAVLQSTIAFNAFMARMAGVSRFTLDVRSAPTVG